MRGRDADIQVHADAEDVRERSSAPLPLAGIGKKVDELGASASHDCLPESPCDSCARDLFGTCSSRVRSVSDSLTHTSGPLCSREESCSMNSRVMRQDDELFSASAKTSVAPPTSSSQGQPASSQGTHWIGKKRKQHERRGATSNGKRRRSHSQPHSVSCP